jgi:ribonuclease BN (tRNA processing enzyme)
MLGLSRLYALYRLGLDLSHTIGSKKMKLQVLGNGGFLNQGIPYNALLLGNDFLIEAPPDIMVSLRTQGIPFSKIRRIYISHFHGDHYFGMPFLALNLVNYYLETGSGIEPIEVIGPKETRFHLKRIQEIATSADNPSVSLLDKLFTFTEIDATSRLKVGSSFDMIFHKMNHSKETYGFSVIDAGVYLLTYFIDTKWDDSFVEILSNKPKYVFCDLNSQPDDKIREHLTEEELMKKALPITGGATQYVGIHLSGVRTSNQEFLKYSQVGDVVEVG